MPIHIEEAAALKRLFDDRAKLTQSAFAAKYGLGTQGNVAHYLHARSPLNAQAAAAFARGLEGVSVRDFSPRLADEIEGLSSALPDNNDGRQPEQVSVNAIQISSKSRALVERYESADSARQAIVDVVLGGSENAPAWMSRGTLSTLNGLIDTAKEQAGVPDTTKKSAAS